ncbi:glycosyltransferase family 2 protein [Stomatohabitans albus]|uniref:glycosyltransferase family 2 protein n=1 Tax=Stomatohabitans albus TaxID=3110766 RepID=UPI00300D7814
MDDVDVTVVLPAYNEAGHILNEIERINAGFAASPYTHEILLIDDGSTDDTAAIVAGAPHVRLVRFNQNRGAGASRRYGTQHAHAPIVAWTDADMSYPNERLPDLVAALERSGANQIVGARRTEEGTHKWARIPAKWVIRKIAESLSRSSIPDLNSGFRAFYRKDALPHLWLLPDGFSCVTTITLAFLCNGLTVEYWPIDYAKRAGKSHFRPIGDAYRYILQVLRMITFFAPLRVFAPPALFLLLLGLGKFLFDIIGGLIRDGDPFRLAANTVLFIVTGLLLFAIGLLADLIVRVGQRVNEPDNNTV